MWTLTRVTKNKRYCPQMTDTGNFAHFLEFVTQNLTVFLHIFPVRNYARCIKAHILDLFPPNILQNMENIPDLMVTASARRA